MPIRAEGVCGFRLQIPAAPLLDYWAVLPLRAVAMAADFS